MMPFRLCLTLLLSVMTLVGCAGSGQRQDAPKRTGLLIEPADADAIGYSPNWARDLQVPERRQLAGIDLLGDVVVTLEHPGNLVSAVSVRNGEVLWRRVIGDPADPLFGPARHEDRILVNTGSRLYALDARSGRTLAVTPLAHGASTGPLVMGDEAVFGSIGGRVFAHNLRGGMFQWDYQLTGRIVAPPVAVGKQVFASDANGVYALISRAPAQPGAQPGTPLWRDPTFGPITARAAFNDESLFIPSADQFLYAVDRQTGQEQWKLPTSKPLTAAAHLIDGTLYLPVPGEAVIALDPATGDERWRTDFSALPVALHDGLLLLVTPDSLRLVDPATGKVRQQRPTLPLATALPGPDGSIILVSPAGRLLRLNPQ